MSGAEQGTRTIAVVSAGLRRPSSTRLLADRLGAASQRALADRGVTATVQHVDLRDHAHDLTNMLLTGFASPELQQVVDTVQGADAVVAVSPIFSGSYNGLFKNFFDVLEDGTLAGVPVLLGATAGTPRHSLALEHALRPLFAYLRAVVVPTSVFGATDDFGAVADRGAQEPERDLDPLSARVDRAAEELAEQVALRAPRTVSDPFADPVPFEQLLGGS